MSALNHSPLEALALNYLSYGFLTAVNSVWTWVAVITAAVSFWRIRASSSPLVSRPEPRGSILDAVSTSSWSPPKTAEEVGPASASTPGETKHLLSAGPTASCGLEGSSKVKFSLCYNEDVFRESDEGGEDEDDGGCNGGRAVVMSGESGWWCDDVWERTTVVRMGDMGWYRCQDLAAIDGSVVRLWGGRRRRAAAGGAIKW
ncbi:hypothetical protein Salat_1039700 [Sesamum alatum]|uniref:Uncharacterized protein n=1 Tax=Sesamum alatum TaxID=300844 RepID=A0AAE1YM91_9LAMI|nr:hypothetical protein Salat_1039700 [Sesamum alatum]